MHSEYLYTISEIAVAVAGFAGIVVAILGAQGRSHDRQSLDLALLKNVLGSTLIAIGSALIPVTLLEMGIEETLVWKVSSVLFAVVATVYVAAHLPTAFKSYRAAGAKFPWTYIMNALIVLGVIVTVTLVAMGKLASSMYLLGPAYFLYAACFSFARVFFSINPERDT